MADIARYPVNTWVEGPNKDPLRSLQSTAPLTANITALKLGYFPIEGEQRPLSIGNGSDVKDALDNQGDASSVTVPPSG